MKTHLRKKNLDNIIKKEKKMNTDGLRDKILKYKNIIEENKFYQTFDEEQKAIVTLLLFFKNNKERIETLSITKETNSIFSKLFSPLEPRNVTHIKTLIYVCEEQGAANIEYDKPMSRQDITKKLNNIISVKSLDQSYGYIKN